MCVINAVKLQVVGHVNGVNLVSKESVSQMNALLLTPRVDWYCPCEDGGRGESGGKGRREEGRGEEKGVGRGE